MPLGYQGDGTGRITPQMCPHAEGACFSSQLLLKQLIHKPAASEVVRQVEMPMHVILIDPFLNFMAYKVDPLVY